MQPRDGYKFSTGVLNEPNHNDVKILVSLNKTIDFVQGSHFQNQCRFSIGNQIVVYEDDN